MICREEGEDEVVDLAEEGVREMADLKLPGMLSR